MSEAANAHPDPKDLWRHRRRLVYASWFLLFAITVAVFMLSDKAAKIEGIVQTLYWVLGFHIISYYGTAVVEAFATMRGRK
jgi:signal transduction histidine kinase